MDLRSIFVANGTGIFILLVLLYVSQSIIRRGTEEGRIYAVMLFGIMAGCFMEAFSYAIDGVVFPGSRILNYAANTYLNCANLLLPLCVLFYIDLGLYNDPKRLWKRYKPQIISAAILVAANVVNYFVPIIYYISPDNVYERRPLSYVYYVAILYYLLSAALLTRRYEKENGTHAFFRISVFIGPILIGAGLQFAFYGLSLAWLSSAIGLTGLFMMQQNELAYIDTLVNTYNRQYFNDLTSAWITRGDTFAGAMFDIDHFKRINDTYGHTQGDAALKAVSDVLTVARADGEWVFRYAGDEFIVLKRGDKPDALHDYLRNVEAGLQDRNRGGGPYALSLSYGTSYFDGGTMDDFIKEMDEGMYRMKEQHHQRDAS